MTRPRPSPWLIAAALSCLGYFALLLYCDIVRPELEGMRLEFAAGRPRVTAVAPGSPADRGGLRAGDVIVAIDGQPAATRLDIEALDQNVELGRSRPFEVRRGGAAVALSLPVERIGADYFRSRQGAVLMAMRGLLFVTLAFGVFIALRRPGDPVALAGAAMLASAGVFSVVLPYRFAAVWRGLGPAGAPLWLPFVATSAIGGTAYVFFALVSARARRPLGTWALALLPLAAVVAAHTADQLRVVYRPGAVTGLSELTQRLLLFVNVAYIGAGLVALVRNYRRLQDVGERRRVRVLVVGALIGWLGVVPSVVGHWLGDVDLGRSLFGSTGATVGAGLFLVFPVSIAYAVLRHRLFDLRLIIRMGVRYALARRAVLWLVPAIALALAADILLHGREPLVEILRRRGVLYLAAAVLAIVAHGQRRRWLDAIDRRFFRERYDARRLLGDLVTDIRHVASFALMAPRVVAAIETALHPEFAAILVRGPLDVDYRVEAATPPGWSPPPLQPDSTLMRLVRVLDKPFEVAGGSATWIRERLPAPDREVLRDGRVELFVPIVGESGPSEAVLVLGVKRSEEPYAREDLELLEAIAESLALLVERSTAGGVERQTLAECPSCGACYDTAAGACAAEGTALVPTRLPRTLAGRYRIERRLGRGGMGTVYAARDVALDRAVAAKTMREEYVGNAHAAERFQHEARAAARFAHPNVVTVHDFGIADGRIAFLIMELLEGVTLRAALADGRPVPPRAAVAVMRDVASAVAAAHARGIVHRDLKPENIFLVGGQPGDLTKVLDFGIAKALPAPGPATPAPYETNPGVLIGTPAYMAPEQRAGGPPGPAWDIWSLAVLAFEMLTGTHPFAEAAGGATVMAPWRATQPGDSAVELPEAWRVFFARAFDANPAARPPTAGRFQEELAAAVATD